MHGYVIFDLVLRPTPGFEKESNGEVRNFCTSSTRTERFVISAPAVPARRGKHKVEDDTGEGLCTVDLRLYVISDVSGTVLSCTCQRAVNMVLNIQINHNAY